MLTRQTVKPIKIGISRLQMNVRSRTPMKQRSGWHVAITAELIRISITIG